MGSRHKHHRIGWKVEFQKDGLRNFSWIIEPLSRDERGIKDHQVQKGQQRGKGGGGVRVLGQKKRGGDGGNSILFLVTWGKE